jgi:tryptophanyl-tRNA synthetase
MREIARRFNERFGPILVEPEHRIPEVGARIMDLQDPTTRCRRPGERGRDGPGAGRSEDGDEEDQERGHRLRLGGEAREGKEGIANLIEILAVARGISEEEVEREFDGSGYGDFRAPSPRQWSSSSAGA